MPGKSLLEFVAPNWLCRLPAGDGKIALTFDDGPDEQTTYLLLDTLHELRIHSTFFLIGEKCMDNEKLLHQMNEEGHELANHGFTHKSHFYFSLEKQKASVVKTHEFLSSCCVNPARLFRPPYGAFNLSTQRVLQSLNYCGVLWSVMIRDWKDERPGLLWSRLKKKIFDGAIIVLHDGHSTTKNLIPLLYFLAEEADKRNWQFVKLDDESVAAKGKSPEKIRI
jgi:peptidoglycan-N-acetylglucosamine deacetylase